MNEYEILGRLLVIHRQCEDIFSDIGSIIDSIFNDIAGDSGDNLSESLPINLNSIKTSLAILDMCLRDYKDLITVLVPDSNKETVS